MQLSVALHGRHDPAAAAHRRRLGPRRGLRGARARRPAVRNLIREGKTHQIPSAMQTGSSVGMQTMDAALAGAHPRRQDHPAPRRVALLDARGAAPPAGLRRRGRRPDRMATYVFKAMDLTGAKATGEVEADTKQVVADQLKARGLIVLDIKAKHGSKEISLDFLQAGQADRPDDPHASARDDDQLGHDDPARALRARGADREQAAGRRSSPTSARTSRPASRSAARSSATPRSSRRSSWP